MNYLLEEYIYIYMAKKGATKIKMDKTIPIQINITFNMTTKSVME